MKTLSLGVDPGMKGAIALYSSSGGLLEFGRLPVMAIPLAPGSKAAMRRKTDARVLGVTIGLWMTRHRQQGDRVIAVIERMQAYRADNNGNASSSAATIVSMAYSAGIIEGVVARFTTEIITPMAVHWKRRVGVTSDKETSIRRAEEMIGCRLPHDVAEAALLAIYGCAVAVGVYDRKGKKKRPEQLRPGRGPQSELLPIEAVNPPQRIAQS